MRQFDESELDVIREIANIGGGHAANALSKMLSQPVRLDVPSVTSLPIEDIPTVLGGREAIVAAVRLRLQNKLKGSILVLFPERSAIDLVRRLAGREIEPRSDLDETAASTLREVGNILGAAFLNAVGTLLDTLLVPSVPGVAFDMAGAVLDAILVDISSESDRALVVETRLSEGAAGLSASFFLLVDQRAASILLDRAKRRDA